MSALFSPLALAGFTLENRIVVSPMCQYSAVDGSATDWHIMHLGQMALSGAGLLILEASGVEPRGRISPSCLGLYSDDNERALERVLKAVRPYNRAKLGIQLGHAGRKASIDLPWRGNKPLMPGAGGWETIAPSAVPFAEGWSVPKPFDRAEMDQIVAAFVKATMRALRLGFDLIELHGAHGYLMSEFLSPLANQRNDEYGGSLENRMRFPLEIARAVRDAWPRDRALGVRLNGSDFMPGGIVVEETAIVAAALKSHGIDYVCVSGGGNSPKQEIPVKAHYQVPFAAEVKRRSGITTMAVGMIADPKAADGIVVNGEADLVALARGLLDDPRWAWHAAEALGAELKVVVQYERARPKLWPGAKLVRPALYA
ncbi:MAG: NADH:flavin oxidoreductase/NADH oxidase [Alphaproteobacteria bacterium]|nr:NADH:flavin oxidoreductase/NADH oxidase [Alphaproteobacteria bacterium]